MSETPTSQRIRLALSALGGRIFRNHRGKHQTVDGRWVETGLTKGASDLIGWYPVTITPDMVGSTLAVFTAIEVKSGKGATTEQQDNFLDAVSIAGGISFVARSEDEALEAIRLRVRMPIRLAV